MESARAAREPVVVREAHAYACSQVARTANSGEGACMWAKGFSQCFARPTCDQRHSWEPTAPFFCIESPFNLSCLIMCAPESDLMFAKYVQEN